MRLEGILQSSVETVFDVASELVQEAVYHPNSESGTYDPATDEYTSAPSGHNCRLIETTVTAEDREASPIEVEDLKIIIPWKDLEGVTLKGVDAITYAGTTKNILARKKIPGKAIHIFFIRQR